MRNGATWIGTLGLALALMTAAGSAQPTRPSPAAALIATELAWEPKTALRQQRLLAEALNGLSAQRPGQRDVYVLSAALWGDAVFDREAAKAGAILAARFGAQGRMLVLSNGSDEAAAAVPAATPAHLSAALGRLGEVMDPAEDVLIVFFTSHGDLKGLSLEDGRRLQGVLGPAALRAALDQAGVRNRIVILSACHSGVFIPALADPHTVVLTAAAREKVSFGCAPDNDWTYFGEALFDGSLKRGRGLAQAFAEAKALIARKEMVEKQTPSDPQIFVGAEAKAFLDAIDKGGG